MEVHFYCSQRFAYITKPKKPNSLEVGLFSYGSPGKMLLGNGKNIYFCRNLGWNSCLDFTYESSTFNLELEMNYHLQSVL